MVLIVGRDYYILHIGIKFKGKYKTFFSNEYCSYYSFTDVKMRTIGDSRFGDPEYSIIEYSHYVFTDIDTFYDIQQMRENKIKAIQSMEQRALDKILKNIVNENFEW
jgi:hypothetical protein